MRAIPGRMLITLLAAGAVAAVLARLAGVPLAPVAEVSMGALLLLAGTAGFDLLNSRRLWRRSQPRLVRRLPPALAIAVRRAIHVSISVEGQHGWQVRVHDHADPALRTEALPATLQLHAGKVVEFEYAVTPIRRGDMHFAPAGLRVRSRLGLWELCERLGDPQLLRCYPDFAQVARYAWLAGSRRLQEIGVKSWHRRGEGTDFRQLAEYLPGDPVRHIDWKATLRLDRPIVRQFQDERDQNVWLLIDCGRRMRADDPEGVAAGSSHFDQVLNAVMLLSYVALHEGDAVGALTFGNAAGQQKFVAPRKGATQLGALMSALHAIQPSLAQPDYLYVARDFLARQPRRSLVILITNFRDEDCSEVADALRLLRQRHLVLVASLREQVIAELAGQPLGPHSAVEVASAHLLAEARDQALERLGGQHGLLVDAEPQRLGIELVNRYHVAKRAGMI